MDAHLIPIKDSIKNLRLSRNISLDILSTCTGIDTEDLDRYERTPSDIPIDDAVKLLGYFNKDFKCVSFQQ
ncbi:hypothetical protein J41TS4_22090 [Paenibacillus apis]|uniref:Uncharacterized protein n=1 Tax=Paenibacillus apis TaxID=1792174 RepID=A0A919Y1M3_9BACL|nr:hypothetical protein J41TS4_22090 [Paenibacillus apis]